MCVVEKSNKKNYQTKTGKKFQFKAKIEKKVILIPFLRWYMENWEGLNPGKNLLHTTTIPWWWYDDHLQIKKKMIVICLLKKNQNDMI